MTNASLIAFVDWWSSLNPVSKPDAAAIAEKEDSHRHYYHFAAELRLRWAACALSAEGLLAIERNRVKRAVKSAAKELVAWFDDVGAPTLRGILSRLREQPDVLLQALGEEASVFASEAATWLDELRSAAAGAADALGEVPPYLSLGVPVGRAEVPVSSPTGIWAAGGVLRPWPWRDVHLAHRALGALKEFGSDTGAVVRLLTEHCEAAWIEALRKVPASSLNVQRQVAASAWAACHVLNLMLDVPEHGQLSMRAFEWAQQFLEPYQLWYLGNNGDVPKKTLGVLVVRPISSLKTAYFPADPVLTNNTSMHVRDYCLFLRFLVESVMRGLTPLVDQRKQAAGAREKRSDEELRALAVAALRINPRLTQREFAGQVGETEKRVSKVANFKELRKLMLNIETVSAEEWPDTEVFRKSSRPK